VIKPRIAAAPDGRLHRWLLIAIAGILVALLGPTHSGRATNQNLDIVPLSEVSGSGVFGDATLIDNDDDTMTVDILVSGVTGGHPAAIRHGTCDDMKAIAFNLVAVDEDGTSVTYLEVELNAFLADGPWAVIIRRSAAAGAPNIACGTIPVVQSSGATVPNPTQTPNPTTQTNAPAATASVTATPTATIDPSLPTCQQFDAWVWAQSVFEQSPDELRPSLDPDNNGVACDQLPLMGFSPALWTDAIPEGLTPVRVTGYYNGDTMQIVLNGQIDVLKLRGVSAPTANQCGYASAASFHAFVLNIAPNRTLYVDYATAQRDSEGRLLADVWYDFSGDPYLINEVVVRNGWAAPTDEQGPFSEQINAAAEFAENHVLGVYFECGGFGLPPGSTPTAEQLQDARENQPAQGQFGA